MMQRSLKGHLSASPLVFILLITCVLALISQAHAFAQATQVIYDDQLENGWQNWSWATANLTNTSPTHTGSDSIAVTDSSSGGYGALWLHPSADISTVGYYSVTFWINPGPVASQQLNVIGVSANNTSNNSVGLPAPLVANTWTKETITMSALGVANISNYAGFWLQNATGAPAATYYLDDITLDPVTSVSVNVNTSSALNKIPANPVGVNTAVWDGYLTDNNTLPLLQAAGVSMLRYPGGSASDSYHWATNSNVAPNDNYTWNSAAAFDPFMTIVSKPLGAQQIITCNYGSNENATGGGDPAEAAAWVQYANITKGYGIKYWEIGNEVYGNGYYATYYDWETDLHDLDQTAADRVGASSLSPVTYGQNIVTYANAMKAVDPTIKVGAVLSLPGSNTASGNLLDWNSNVLQQCGSSIGFVILHWYAEYGTDNDSVLLSDTSQIAGWASQTQALINQYCGTNAPNVQIIVDELNSDAGNPGKQMLSTVNALFMADNFQTWLENGAANTDYWDLRNGAGNGDSSSTLFGTLQYGDEGILSNGTSTTVNGVNYTEPPVDTPFPAYYAIQMVHYLGNPGDTMVASTSTQPLVTSHAVHRADGSVGVLLINKDPVDTFSTTVTVPNFIPGSTGTIYTYGPNTTTITTTPFTPAGTVSLSLPPYTMETLSMQAQPVAPTPVISPISGTYTSPLQVTISDPNVGTTLRYTTDGSNPATSTTATVVSVISNNYFQTNLTLTNNAIVSAVVTEPGYTNSPVVTSPYTVNSANVPTPVITPGSGSYVNSVSMSVSDSLAGATIKYTSDGSDPATSAGARVYSAPVTFTRGANITVVAIKSGYSNSAEVKAAYTITSGATAPTPVIAPSAGTYVGSVGVTITDSLSGATIKYTTDGTNPATSGTAQTYSTGFTLTSSATVAAVAIKSGYANSAIATSAYTVTPIAPAPVISPNGATFTAPVPVTITDSLTGAAIKYTTDGTNPATSSTAQTYSAGFTLNASATVNAIAIKSGYAASALSTQTYTINAGSVVPTPVITPGTGSYSKTVTETITESLAGVTLKYTSDGSDPATNVNARTTNGTIVITRSSTIRVVGIKTGYLNSAEPTATVTITP